MNVVTEVVTMKLIPSIMKEDFIAIVDNLEKHYHSKQPGFIDSELFYDERSNLCRSIYQIIGFGKCKDDNRRTDQMLEFELGNKKTLIPNFGD